MARIKGATMTHKPRKQNNRKEEAIPQIQNQAATTSLGENDALAALKAKMEKGE